MYSRLCMVICDESMKLCTPANEAAAFTAVYSPVFIDILWMSKVRYFEHRWYSAVY